jgi:chromosome segregation ATPase
LLKQALQTMSNNVIASQEGVPGLEQRLNSLTHELAESEEMAKDAVRAREAASSRLADIEASSHEREDKLSRLRAELEAQNTIIQENELLLVQLKETSHESRSMAREDQESQSMPSAQLAQLQVENQHLEKNMQKRLDEIEGERAKAQQMKEENYMLKRSTRKSEKSIAELKKEIDTMKSNASNEAFQREEAQRIAHEKFRNQADEELKDVLDQLNMVKAENENLSMEMIEMNEVRGSNQDLRIRRSSSSSPTSWHTTESTEGKNMIDAYHMEREHRIKSDEMAATLAKRAKAGTYPLY